MNGTQPSIFNVWGASREPWKHARRRNSLRAGQIGGCKWNGTRGKSDRFKPADSASPGGTNQRCRASFVAMREDISASIHTVDVVVDVV